MTWAEFTLARLLLAEERVGSVVRHGDRKELAEDAATKDLLRSRGLVS